MNKTLRTKFGTAKLQKNGWYYVSSNEHGHRGKALHRINLRRSRKK